MAILCLSLFLFVLILRKREVIKRKPITWRADLIIFLLLFTSCSLFLLLSSFIRRSLPHFPESLWRRRDRRELLNRNKTWTETRPSGVGVRAGRHSILPSREELRLWGSPRRRKRLSWRCLQRIHLQTSIQSSWPYSKVLRSVGHEPDSGPRDAGTKLCERSIPGSIRSYGSPARVQKKIRDTHIQWWTSKVQG